MYRARATGSASVSAAAEGPTVGASTLALAMSQTCRDLNPFARIIVSEHADGRIRERLGVGDLDLVRGEIRAAMLQRHYRWEARNVFHVWAGVDRDRRYVIARRRGGDLVVITVLTPSVTVVERSGPPLRVGVAAR